MKKYKEKKLTSLLRDVEGIGDMECHANPSGDLEQIFLTLEKLDINFNKISVCISFEDKYIEILEDSLMKQAELACEDISDLKKIIVSDSPSTLDTNVPSGTLVAILSEQNDLGEQLKKFIELVIRINTFIKGES